MTKPPDGVELLEGDCRDGNAERDTRLYATDDATIAAKVRDWAVANGDNPQLRITLCGYEGEHAMPADWACIPWKAKGGYGSQGNGRGRANAGRERLWLSPYCQPTDRRRLAESAGPLFAFNGGK